MRRSSRGRKKDAVCRLELLRQAREPAAMELYWEDDYAIALALNRVHPGVDPLEIDRATLQQWVSELPEFADDKSVTAHYLLENIQREWYEEVASHESTV